MLIELFLLENNLSLTLNDSPDKVQNDWEFYFFLKWRTIYNDRPFVEVNSKGP